MDKRRGHHLDNSRETSTLLFSYSPESPAYMECNEDGVVQCGSLMPGAVVGTRDRALSKTEKNPVFMS